MLPKLAILLRLFYLLRPGRSRLTVVSARNKIPRRACPCSAHLARCMPPQVAFDQASSRGQSWLVFAGIVAVRWMTVRLFARSAEHPLLVLRFAHRPRLRHPLPVLRRRSALKPHLSPGRKLQRPLRKPPLPLRRNPAVTPLSKSYSSSLSSFLFLALQVSRASGTSPIA